LPTAPCNGARINFVQLDEGGTNKREHLVMVHGLATNMAFWYLKYASQLASEFRVTLFDLRGHGRSEMTPTGYAPANLATDLAELLDHLQIARAHFVAHSFGGVVVMNFALRQPERVQSLVLADTHVAVARHNRDTREWAHGLAIQRTLDQHGFGLDTQDPYFGYKLLTHVAHRHLHGIEVPDDLADLVNPLMGGTGGRTAAQWLKLMETTSAESEMMGDDNLSLDALRKFKFPIAAIYGERSPARLTGTGLLNVWPHAEFRNVRNAGHFFPASRPDELIAACRRFWQKDFEDTQSRWRTGEIQRSFFRSDRVFRDEDGWYATTREAGRLGPFAESEQARAVLTNLHAPPP
jgi:pimeloyl-ACP methyl ester carboxylesterase